jgi:hypothetical protein
MNYEVHEIKCGCYSCKIRTREMFYEIISVSFGEDDVHRLANEIAEEFPRHVIAQFAKDDD